MIESILFDLGNVCIQVNPQHSISRLSRSIGHVSEREIDHFLHYSELTNRFERGMISPEFFYRGLLEQWSADFSYDFFKEIWNDIFLPIRTVVDLLPKLSKKYRLLCVSNTNMLHIEYIRNHFQILQHFDHLIFSYQIGIVKPESGIYLEALRQAQSKPRDSLFVDDKQENIRAAQEMGIQAIHFRNYTALVRQLRDLKIRV